MKRRYFFTLLIVLFIMSFAYLAVAGTYAHPMVDPEIIDYTATFGQRLGNPGYDYRADSTGDGLVNISDFNYQKAIRTQLIDCDCVVESDTFGTSIESYHRSPA